MSPVPLIDYGLRDYGTATWEGGDDDCKHTVSHYSDNLKPNVDRPFRGDRTVCLKCGARRIDNQIGLEETPDAYVAKLVDVFREVRRLLKDDGTLWLNLGDSYASTPAGNTDATWTAKQASNAGSIARRTHSTIVNGLKPKDLIGIPWLVAFALRADGWWLRSDIIWHKPNPMPESVTDRPTKAHEYIFLLSKSARYFYDAEAVREPNAGDLPYGDKRNFKMNDDGAQGQHGKSSMFAGGTREEYIERYYTNGRNRRSVWTVTTKPYSGAHFATFPPDLIEPCILAGTSAHGCCAECGAVWERVTEKEPDNTGYKNGPGGHKRYQNVLNGGNGSSTLSDVARYNVTTLGWQPTCTCNADVVPCTVLDPFNGSGTTGAVALKYGRDYIGCELNPDYIELAHERIGRTQPQLMAV